LTINMCRAGMIWPWRQPLRLPDAVSGENPKIFKIIISNSGRESLHQRRYNKTLILLLEGSRY
ncbi:hypothetical protein L9F63_027035, partial [Diploptera punctata]